MILRNFLIFKLKNSASSGKNVKRRYLLNRLMDFDETNINLHLSL